MPIEDKDYLALAAALASVAGALSAIAFAFFQAAIANRTQLVQQLTVARGELARRILALNEHLRLQDADVSVPQDIKTSEEFDSALLAALKDGVAKINDGLLSVFNR